MSTNLPTNIFEEVTYYECDYVDLEALIYDVYKKKVSVGGSLEAHNDSSHAMYIDGDVEEEDLEDFLSATQDGWRGIETNLYVVMDDMCRKGIIKPGNYLINVSW